MPKVKTHHWTGVTLSMKNMFGIVPGCRYGWPKNVLHWAGIHESILDICATVRPHFVIADAIVAMHGDGPLNGMQHKLNRLVLSDDPVAADLCCIDLLEFSLDRVRHVAEAGRFLGNTSTNAIEHLTRGDSNAKAQEKTILRRTASWESTEHE
jgi:uncharacterized protein (DUF362 family)